MNNEVVQFITCGSVDDGKSTLIGRLLHDTNSLFDDQLETLKSDSKKFGTQKENIDFALLTDGLLSEREQGITIDVAYKYFDYGNKKFIIADTPGHEQYTRNMATGASTADVAIILIDARKGVLTQTKRHSFIVSLLGIKNIIVAINKMDLVDFSEKVFEKIQSEYEKIIPNLPYYNEINFSYLPISALQGDNIVYESINTSWYKKPTLMKLLHTIDLQTQKSQTHSLFRFPVQYVNRPNLDFRGYCGTIASGSISVGDTIVVLPSNQKSKVKSIIPPTLEDMTVQTASKDMAITLTLESEIDISRGDMIVKEDAHIQTSKKISAMVVWMSDTPMETSSNYIIKITTALVNGTVSEILYKKDINTFEEQTVQQLHLNDIAKVTITLDKLISFDSYHLDKTTGSFIIIDRYSNETVGAGMIISSVIQSSKQHPKRIYSKEEIALNKMIREKYPEWKCKAIYE